MTKERTRKQASSEEAAASRVGAPVQVKTEEVASGKIERIVIQPLNLQQTTVLLRGTSVYCQHAFSQKAQEMMIAKQKMGSLATKGKKREAKDFDRAYTDSMYVTKDGWHGFHSGGLRTAMVDCCRLVGFKMTIAKMSLFVLADGYDVQTRKPITRITKGEPSPLITPMKNDNGSVDMRMRAVWEPGWEAKVRVQWDADQFEAADVVNLLVRVGVQAGLGEGRPNSKECTGCGWGTFEVIV